MKHKAVHKTMPALFTRTGAAITLLGAIAVLVCGCFLLPNRPPTARIMADRLTGQPPLSVRFDGTTSDDQDGIVATYLWEFGEGTFSERMRPSHEYNLPGEYSVTLTVTDNDGAASSAMVSIIVLEPNIPPVATFRVWPSTPLPGETVKFDADESFDQDGWIMSYRWDFGDGSTAAGSIAEHPFAASGRYLVALTVVDNHGAAVTHTRELLVIDTNQPPRPLLELSATTLNPGETLYGSAAGSTDPDGEIVSLEWQFGDGTRAEGPKVTHVYSADGAYRVTLTATDNQGAKQSIQRMVTVETFTDPPSELPGVILLNFRWSYNGIRTLSIDVPESLYQYYRSQSRGVWSADGYSRFVLDPRDDLLMEELGNALFLNNSYQLSIENALAFVQKSVRYQLDPAGTEFPRYPVETLVEGVGDCEDSAILYASIVRTFGPESGVLLVSMDTNSDQVMDHVAVFVRVADCFIAAHPQRSLWNISGYTYAFAETAVSGGYLALGVDPWGIEEADIHHIWDVSNPSAQLQATRLRSQRRE